MEDLNNIVYKTDRFAYEKNLSSKSALSIPMVSTSTFHLTYYFFFSCHNIPTNSVAPFSAYKPKCNRQFLQSLRRRANT